MVTHPVRLRGLLQSTSGAPSILQRTDQEFIPAILDELAAGDNFARIAGTIAQVKDTNGLLKLFQPVQRTFHVALLEGFCEIFGEPRLAARSIDSMGLVLRRVAVDENGRPSGNRYEAWCQAGAALRGWILLSTPEQDQDPDPARRPPALSAGNAEIDRRLSLLHGITQPLAEGVSPLFVAPPAVCEATHRTVLYGLVPLVSSEISEAPDPSAQESVYTAPDVQDKLLNHLHRYLKTGGPCSVPRAGQVVNASSAEAADLQEFMTLLQQVSIELDAFGEGPQSLALFNVLEGTTLTFSNNPLVTRSAGQFLQEATRVLLERDTSSGSTITMPLNWPQVSQQQGQAILTAVQASLTARRALVKPQEGRFDGLQRRYVLRAFIRVQREGDCPPELVWSDHSEPFTIAPWYETGDAPPVQVALPDLNRDALKRLKPNVVFAVPESLQNILAQNDPKKLAAGTGTQGSGSFGLDWLCSFSIPIITLCAFIVLNIFLQLFNIIFSWMLFIKICIPIPRRN